MTTDADKPFETFDDKRIIYAPVIDPQDAPLTSCDWGSHLDRFTPSKKPGVHPLQIIHNMCEVEQEENDLETASTVITLVSCHVAF